MINSTEELLAVFKGGNSDAHLDLEPVYVVYETNGDDRRAIVAFPDEDSGVMWMGERKGDPEKYRLHEMVALTYGGLVFPLETGSVQLLQRSDLEDQVVKRAKEKLTPFELECLERSIRGRTSRGI